MPSLLKGTVRSYDAGTGTAEVEVVGAHGRYITVPVATDLDDKTVVAGKKCAVVSFNERDQGDAVLIATYDDVFLMGSSPTDDHDHTGDAGDGGQLEADLALLATGDAAGDLLTAQGDNSVAWEAPSSSPGAAAKVLKSAADGILQLVGLKAGSVQAPDGNGLGLYEDGGEGIYIADGGDVGIGVVPEFNVHVKGPTFPTLMAERTTSGVNSYLSSMGVGVATSGDMIDGFGAGFSFRAKDNADSWSSLAGIYGFRDGGDGYGGIYLSVSVNGLIGGNERVTIRNSGRVGIGDTDPQAWLHIRAGSASAATAPIKLTSGTLMTTPEAGAIEFDGSDFYISI